MKERQAGLGLIEIMIAMTLGLVIVLGITQIFLSSKQTYRAQDAVARLQEDARYVLTRMTQELRMAGMYGCLATSELSGLPSAFEKPIDWDNASKKLTIITANVATGSVTPVGADWTLKTDCRSTGSVVNNDAAPDPNAMAFPIRMVEYQYVANTKTLSIKNGPLGNFQPLVTGVKSFEVSFGLAETAADLHVIDDYTSDVVGKDALIRSVRIALTMSDPSNLARDQTYLVVAALRNRTL